MSLAAGEFLRPSPTLHHGVLPQLPHVQECDMSLRLVASQRYRVTCRRSSSLADKSGEALGTLHAGPIKHLSALFVGPYDGEKAVPLDRFGRGESISFFSLG